MPLRAASCRFIFQCAALLAPVFMWPKPIPCRIDTFFYFFAQKKRFFKKRVFQYKYRRLSIRHVPQKNPTKLMIGFQTKENKRKQKFI